MAIEFDKPSKLEVIWADNGDILDPGDTKYETGWGVEIPPRQWENYIQNKQDAFIAHANQHGTPAWDSTSQYLANKSYVQGTTSGAIYRAKLDNIGQDPELDTTNTYWSIAFASSGDFYTKTESDSTFLKVASNLSDLADLPTARNNLSVYSKAETYTKTEVDAKTTVASTAQAQALTSNTVLISALRLAEAFKGSNQSLTANGYQKFPGGFTVQWGQTASVASDASVAVTFPIAFPTACFVVIPASTISGISFDNGAAVLGTPTTTGCTLVRTGGWDGTFQAGILTWVAIGY